MSPVPVIGTQAVQPPLLAAGNQASVCLYARSGAGTGALWSRVPAAERTSARARVLTITISCAITILRRILS